MRALKVLGIIAVVTMTFLGYWAFWWEPSSLHVVEERLEIFPWHPEHRGLRVAVLGDLHVGSPHMGMDKLKVLVDRVNAEKPDLVLILGDLVIQGVVGGKFVPPEPIALELGTIQAPLGVTAVLGNHDWWFDGARVRRALESQHITVLEGSSRKLSYRGKAFWLTGFGDLWTQGEHVAETMATVRDKDPMLAMMHNPDIFPDLPARISLSLAGHTHGGQVNFPLIGRPVVPSKFGQRYAYGKIVEDGRMLFVTGGIGTSIIPVRFRVEPEIVMLTLDDARKN